MVKAGNITIQEVIASDKYPGVQLAKGGFLASLGMTT